MSRRSIQLLALAFTVTLLAACSAATPREENPELARARAATEKYRSVDSALADGYEDIKVVMPRMGHHYMKSALLDGTFEPERPEMLVYSPVGNNLELVAIEYAVPVDTANPAPPAGFTGDADVWEQNEQYGIWTLHAWIYKDNPDGLFTAHNPAVP